MTKLTAQESFEALQEQAMQICEDLSAKKMIMPESRNRVLSSIQLVRDRLRLKKSVYKSAENEKMIEDFTLSVEGLLVGAERQLRKLQVAKVEPYVSRRKKPSDPVDDNGLTPGLADALEIYRKREEKRKANLQVPESKSPQTGFTDVDFKGFSHNEEISDLSRKS